MFYSSCGTCGDIMQVSFTGQDHHPGCNPTEVFRLTNEWCDAAQREDPAECDRLQKEINKLDGPARLGPSALWYASIGWPVFPLLPGSKMPATKHGFKDATVDGDRIREWWTKHPESNIGLPTGVMFDVIDIDGPEGIKSLADLGPEALGNVHGKVGTPRGFHYYVASSGDGNRVGIRPGIDYRGVGGYVCAPPSRIEFKKWVWLMQPSPAIRKAA